MAHWAEVDGDSVVVRVLVGNNADPDEGHQWLLNNLGGTWVKTSYNTSGGVHSEGGTPLRKNYAGIGYTYDSARDAFIPPKPFASWALDEETCFWNAPIPMPVEEGKMFTWNEETTSWDEITL